MIKDEKTKCCYQGPKGFVHVYKHGSRVCNCGECKINIPVNPNIKKRKYKKKKKT